MTKEEANREAMKIIDHFNKEVERIVEEARKNGTWSMGLDANRGLFEGIETERNIKLKQLAEMIDEE